MNADFQDFKYRELTEKIIKAFYKVYNTLWYGFLEKVYENALLIELAKLDIPVIAQSSIKVVYDGKVLADILVDNKVIVEIKATKCLVDEHEA